MFSVKQMEKLNLYCGVPDVCNRKARPLQSRQVRCLVLRNYSLSCLILSAVHTKSFTFAAAFWTFHGHICIVIRIMAWLCKFSPGYRSSQLPTTTEDAYMQLSNSGNLENLEAAIDRTSTKAICNTSVVGTSAASLRSDLPTEKQPWLMPHQKYQQNRDRTEGNSYLQSHALVYFASMASNANTF